MGFISSTKHWRTSSIQAIPPKFSQVTRNPARHCLSTGVGGFPKSLFGEASVLDTREGTDTRIVDDALILEQQSHSLKVNEQGSIGIMIGLIGPDVGMSVVIEEEVRDGITRCLKYAVWLLDLIDRTNRLTHCAVAAAIVGGSFLAWRTREEHAQSPNQVTMSGLGGDRPQPVNLSPPHRTRSALRLDPGGLAEDLTVLLRRRWRT